MTRRNILRQHGQAKVKGRKRELQWRIVMQSRTLLKKVLEKSRAQKIREKFQKQNQMT